MGMVRRYPISATPGRVPILEERKGSTRVRSYRLWNPCGVRYWPHATPRVALRLPWAIECSPFGVSGVLKGHWAHTVCPYKMRLETRRGTRRVPV